MPCIYLKKLIVKSGIMLGYLNWALQLGKIHGILGHEQASQYGLGNKIGKGALIM
jgi:hypothetical protein